MKTFRNLEFSLVFLPSLLSNCSAVEPVPSGDCTTRNAMALSGMVTVRLYSAPGRHHLEDEHLESPRVKEDIDILMPKDGYRPGEGTMPGTDLGTGGL